MFKNYIKTAWRNLWKGRLFNLMNIVGLTVAIASSALLLLTVYYEFSYDKFHKNVDDIYQLYTTTNRPQKPEKSATMPIPLAPSLKAEYPAVKYITRYNGNPTSVKYGNKTLDEDLTFVDPDFFKMFSFDFIQGDKRGLIAINDVVLSKSTAKAIFGNIDPIGKVISLKYEDKPGSFLVKAVVDDLPSNSSINSDIFVRFDNTPSYLDNAKQWNNRNHVVFAQLNSSADVTLFEKSLSSFVRKYFKEDLNNLKRDGAKPLATGDPLTLNITPFGNSHFNTEIIGFFGTPVSKTYIIALLVIGIFILIIACINFINLAVARSFTRAREIGVRKTLGASKWQLLTQFWTETIMVCLIALVAGIALATLILPAFKANFRSHISISMLLQPTQLIIITALFLFITIIAGFYPAWLMMRYKTVLVLKGTVNTSKPGKVRNTLLVIQFSIATILTICTLVTWQQVAYLQNKPLGYNKSEVLSIPVGTNISGDQALRVFRNEMAGNPQVLSITGAFNNFGRGNDGSRFSSVSTYNYKGHEMRTNLQKVDYDFLKTLDIKLVNGRDFSHDYPSDSNSVIINEKMAAQVGGGVGAFLPMVDDKKPMQVIGVVKDYNFESLHQDVEPLTLCMMKRFPVNYIFVKLKPNNLVTGYNTVKEKWHAAFPNIEFLGSYLNENTEKEYQSEKRLSNIFISAAIIAIIISCIGLLAMSVMVIVQRTKEIGIRKVLGASISNIVLLLSQEFIKLVLLASVIAFPIAWWLMYKWLESFAYRVEIHWWVFVLATSIALVIAMLTISFQAIKAAVTNPVKSIKSE